MSGVTINRILTISTGHVSKETADWLNAECLKNALAHTYSCGDSRRNGGAVFGASTAEGWWLYCHEELNDVPSDLMDLFAWAREKHGVDYIQLDCDGDEMDGLKSYDW